MPFTSLKTVFSSLLVFLFFVTFYDMLDKSHITVKHDYFAVNFLILLILYAI